MNSENAQRMSKEPHRMSHILFSNSEIRSGNSISKRLLSAHDSVLRRDDRALLSWSNISFYVPSSSSDKKIAAKAKSDAAKQPITNVN